jgi:hypothetical protein
MFAGHPDVRWGKCHPAPLPPLPSHARLLVPAPSLPRPCPGAVFEPTRRLVKVALQWYPGETDMKGPHELELKIFAGVTKVGLPMAPPPPPSLSPTPPPPVLPPLNPPPSHTHVHSPPPLPLWESSVTLVVGCGVVAGQDTLIFDGTCFGPGARFLCDVPLTGNVYYEIKKDGKTIADCWFNTLFIGRRGGEVRLVLCLWAHHRLGNLGSVSVIGVAPLAPLPPPPLS